MKALVVSIGLVAGAALAFQVLLMRLLGIVHWQPFAAMVISLALLGHGASGTWLALRRDPDWPRFDRAYPLCVLLFALSAPLAFAAAQRLPFNGLELVWDARQWLWLPAMFALLGLPFFFAASAIGLALATHRALIGRLYGADLLGAGLGVAAVVALLYVVPAQQGLRAVGLVAVAAAALTAPRARLTLLAAGCALTLLWPGAWLAPQPTPYKALPRTLLFPGAQIVAERSGPLGALHVVASPQLPLRHVPGLSLLATQEPAPQLAVFTDGDALSAITRRAPDRARLAYLGQTTSALPYALLPAPRVLLLGAGGGSEVLQALTLGAREVVAVEANPQLAGLLLGPFADWSGDLYRDPRVRLQLGAPRQLLRRAAPGDFDLIQFALSDSLGGSVAGVQAPAESSVYTVEALAEAYARLRPGGLIALTRWDKQPPRDSLKLVASAVTMLRSRGVEPAAQLAMIRSWQTDTLLIARDPLDARQQAALQAFCVRLGFDVVHAPGRAAAQRFHQLREDRLAEGMRALLGPQAAGYVATYPFDLRPATDDRPYFHNFFRWRALPQLWQLRREGGAALLDAGYLLVLAALAAALPLALLLVLLPLWRLRRQARGGEFWRGGGYFLCLGLGFLFVEIAALARIGLLLGQPLLAATLVLAAMLVFAGLGSTVSARLAGRTRLACGLVAALIAGLALLQGPLFALATGWPLPSRLLVATLWLAPLAFLMGLPFPLGLGALAAQRPALLPWAWGVNGCASVLSPLLATLLGIHVGLRSVLLVAAGLYALAACISVGAAVGRDRPANGV